MYNKKDLISEIFSIENIEEKIVANNVKIDSNLLIEILATSNYSLKDSLSLSAATISKYLKILWPDRPSTTNKVDIWLLNKYGYKECKKCSIVYDLSFFHKSKSRSDGLNAACKKCQIESTSVTSAKRQASYKAALLKRVPSWITNSELEEISKFYALCPEGYHIDHIIPLQGTNVSGLHTLSNLQYLKAEENLSKKNIYLPV